MPAAGLMYNSNGKNDLECYVDSDFVGQFGVNYDEVYDQPVRAVFQESNLDKSYWCEIMSILVIAPQTRTTPQ